MADTLAAAGAAARLGELGVAGKRIDDVAGKMGAVGRCQRSALLTLEIIMQDEFAVVVGKDQVNAGSLEVAVEQKPRVRDDDRVRRRMRGVVSKSLDVARAMGMQTRAVSRQPGVKFARVIQ